MLNQNINYHGRTDVGIVREHNEDAFGFFGAGGSSLGDTGTSTPGGDVIAVLSDGVGGHDAGELASSATVAAVGALIGQLACVIDPDDADTFRERVEPAMAGQNTNLRLLSKHQGQGQKNMAATLTSVWLAAGRIHMVHAGDSRLYRWREGSLEQLSVDDTIAGRGIAAGEITEKEGREDKNWHVLQRAMGIEERKFGVTVHSWAVADGDAYLLCSDGLTDGLTNPQLEKGFARFDAAEPAAFCERLIEAGNQASGKDNITVCMLQVEEGWVAASQNPENRKFFNSHTMQVKTPKFLIPVLLILALGLGVALYGLFRVQQSNEAVISAMQTQQAEIVASYEAQIAQMQKDLAQLETELLEERESSMEAMARMWEDFKSAMQKQADALMLATDQSLRELNSTFENTKSDLSNAMDAAQQKTASVAGQLEGVWAKMDEYKEEIEMLKSMFLEKPAEPKVSVAPSAEVKEEALVSMPGEDVVE